MARFISTPFAPGGIPTPGLGPTIPGERPPFPGGGGAGIPIPGVPTIPGLGEAQICPPGTACSGPSINLPFGLSGCLGACRDIASQPQDPGTGEPFICPPGYVYRQGPFGTFGCFDSQGQPLIDVSQDPTLAGNGARACPTSSSCTLPNQRKGRLNKTKYYRFGDCRRGTSAGVVQPGTVCTTPRRTNYGNDKAAMRAARRLNGAARHYHKMLSAVDAISDARKRKPRKR